MARDNNKKIIMIIALIAVISISIGFAAYTASLTIKSTATVTPDSSAFKIVFSTSPNELKEGTVSVNSIPTTLEASDAIINNSINSYPMITDMDVVFTQPGQYVTYEFYAINKGKYDAYLTSIVLENLDSGKYQECIAGEGATQESADSACYSMRVTVTVGNESVTSTKTGIKNHKLQIDESEKVTVKIEYLSTGTIADGPVEVNFGDIYLSYGTSELAEDPIIPDAEYACALANLDGSIDIGDIITCGTESFYVMPNHEKATTGTVSMLAKYNLNVGEYKYNATEGIQNENVLGDVVGLDDRYGTVFFSDTYLNWTHDSYPVFVYDDEISISDYVENYEIYLKSNLGGGNNCRCYISKL